MMKRFVPVLAACLFLMFGTAQAATSLALPPPDTKGGKPLMQTLSGRATNRTFTANRFQTNCSAICSGPRTA